MNTTERNDNTTFRYLNFFFEKNGLHSIIDFNNSETKHVPSYFSSKLITEFEHTIYEENKTNILDIVFKTKSNIFVYLSKIDKWDSEYYIKILFQQENKDEVSFLINSLRKKNK